MRNFVLVVAVTLGLTACATVRMPLCPSVARYSYPDRRSDTPVNYYLRERAAERNVRIAPLSHFAANLSGARHDVNWMVKNYKFMLCAFDPAQARTDRKETYDACMNRATDWIAITQSVEPEKLMADETVFLQRCATNYESQPADPPRTP